MFFIGKEQTYEAAAQACEGFDESFIYPLRDCHAWMGCHRDVQWFLDSPEDRIFVLGSLCEDFQLLSQPDGWRQEVDEHLLIASRFTKRHAKARIWKDMGLTVFGNSHTKSKGFA